MIDYARANNGPNSSHHNGLYLSPIPSHEPELVRVLFAARADDAVPRAAAPVRCLEVDAAAVAFSGSRLVVAGRGGAVGVDDCMDDV